MKELSNELRAELAEILPKDSNVSYTEQIERLSEFLLRNKLVLDDIRTAENPDMGDILQLHEGLQRTLRPSTVPAVTESHPHITGASEGKAYGEDII